MSAYSGPKISDDGLVFAFDMSNTQKSWKGAPTTNLFAGINLTSWSGVGSRIADTTVTSETRNGGTVWRLKDADGVDPNTLIDNYYMYNSYSPVVDGEKYTLSLDVKVIQKSNAAKTAASNCIWVWYAGSTDFVYFFDLPLNEWVRVYVTCTAGATYNYLMPRIDYDNSIVEISNIQFEKLDVASPFINGTRSTTQSILDLTGNTTITNTGLTYNSDGTFKFNGTTDYLRPSVNHSYLSSSAIEVIFRSTNHGTGYKTIAGYRQNGGYSLPTIGSIYLNGNTLSASVITTSQVYRTVEASTLISTNTTYHVVLNKDTVNGVMQLYVNGVLRGTQTFDAATYAYWGGGYVGANILDIGKSSNNVSGQGWSNDYFEGSIYQVKLYNRILSADEIQQNFIATRSRYGI